MNRRLATEEMMTVGRFDKTSARRLGFPATNVHLSSGGSKHIFSVLFVSFALQILECAEAPLKTIKEPWRWVQNPKILQPERQHLFACTACQRESLNI
jgi:hypothetical protein